MIKISGSVNKVLLAYTPQLISMLICLWHKAESNSSDKGQHRAQSLKYYSLVLYRKCLPTSVRSCTSREFTYAGVSIPEALDRVLKTFCLHLQLACVFLEAFQSLNKSDSSW